MTPEDRWITVDAAAQLSGYHPDTIRDLLREHKIAGRKISIVWLVDRKSLISFLGKAEAKGGKRGPKRKTQSNRRPKA